MSARPISPSPRELAVHIITTLRQGGHTAYLAGGCVRDGLLGITPKDYDVATDAKPDSVRALFPGSRFVGEAFGVVLVRRGRTTVEVATFRREWGYHDGRRPDHVEFSDAQHDALRRDFTINGLFEDPLAADPQARIIDFVGGQEDLQRRVIRAIGDPEERFGEDYLRLLRAVRFAAALGFDLDPRTAEAIRATAAQLSGISRERIGQEVRRMLDPRSADPRSADPRSADPRQGDPRSATRPLRAAKLLQELRLDAPALHEEHADPPLPVLAALVGEAPCQQSGRQPSGGGRAGVTFPAVLAAWALDRWLPGGEVKSEKEKGKSERGRNSEGASAGDSGNEQDGRPSPQPESGDPSEGRGGGTAELYARAEAFVQSESVRLRRRWRKALCLTNEDCQALADIFDFLLPTLTWATLGTAERKRLLAWDHWAEVLAVASALDRAISGSDDFSQALSRQAVHFLKEGVAPPPLLTGDDLVALGRTPGPDFKPLLDAAYDAQLEGRLTTREEALAWAKTH